MSTEPLEHRVDPDVSMALREAKGRRADLHAVIVALERTAAAPAPGRHADWCDSVHDAVVDVGAAFERHIAATEGPEGLFEEMAQAAPRLTGVVKQLRMEHSEIRRAIGSALKELRDLAHLTGADVPSQARELVMSLLDQLIRHRQIGADLVYEAYAVDIGVGD